MIRTRTILLLLIIFCLIPSASAWGVHTHITWTSEVLNETDTPITKIINANEDAFYCGLLAADVSVIHYYTNFKRYQATHDTAFTMRCHTLAKTDRERAFCYGISAHHSADAVSHNYFVPMVINRYRVPNYFIHPTMEAAIENEYINLRTAYALEPIDEFLPLMNEALGRDVTSDAHLLKSIVSAGNFYDQGYSIPHDASIQYKGYALFMKFISMFVSIPEYEAVAYEQQSKQAIVESFHGSYTALDPSGASALAASDANIKLGWYVVLLAAIIGLIVLRWRMQK